jgi:signal transduction histidine kinase
MKLFVKTTLFYLLASLIVFTIGGVITYNKVKEEVALETDYYLNETFRRLVNEIKSGKSIGVLNNDKVTITKLDNQLVRDTFRVYSDTISKHPLLNRPEAYRRLVRISKVEEQYYQFDLMDVLIESDDVYQGVTAAFVRLFLFLGLFIIAANTVFFRWILSPFYLSLRQIMFFNVKDKDTIQLPDTNTREFKLLNAFILKMTHNARKDYLTLKEFTENASHEMQTPVAIAKGKLELLMESGDLTQDQLQLVQGANQALSKLSKIGKSLTLLSKIENGEFSDKRVCNFSEVVGQNVDHFRELALLRNINMQAMLPPVLQLPIDSALADILISNLIKNAIQHNDNGGWINIKLNEQQLEVSNSGKAPSVPTENLFNRFKKGQSASSSLGLGLAIVKKITDTQNWQVVYKFTDQTHSLRIVFT